MGKYTYEDVKNEFEERGYILITDHKVKGNEKYEYICKKHLDKGSQFIDWGHFHCTKRGCWYCGRERTEAARRKDLSEYDGKTLAESKGFEYVGMSKHDKKVWVQFICPRHREYGVQEMPFNNMKRVVVGCQHCIGRNDDEEAVLREMYEANPYIELIDPYGGRTKRVRMRCIKHDIISTKTPYEVIMGRGCVQCGIEKTTAAVRMPEDVFVSELEKRYSNVHLVSGYIAKGEYANFHCDDCYADWTDIASYVMTRGCPRCNGFSAEVEVSKILQQYKINYIPQYSFKDCKDQRSLPFDFYLPDYHILIEYDGEQHYRAVNFGGIPDIIAMQNLKITQQHDAIKNKYCEDNNIPFIRIPYWERKNLESVLISNLQQYVLI